MAYNGWLVKVGNYTIPAGKFIKASSYSAYRNIQDLDSYRDANGVLHRTALEHVPLKVEFETPAMLTDKEFEAFMKNLRNNFTIRVENKFIGTVYVPTLGEYVTQEMYMPEPQPSIYGTYGGVIHYNPIRIAFIGY